MKRYLPKEKREKREGEEKIKIGPRQPRLGEFGIFRQFFLSLPRSGGPRSGK
jgi:hypothetical protein